MIAMETYDQLIQASTEFVCERWSQGEGSVDFFAPVTRVDGVTWIHPASAKEWAAIQSRATRVWLVSGSFWNPRGFTLVYVRGAGESPLFADAA